MLVWHKFLVLPINEPTQCFSLLSNNPLRSPSFHIIFMPQQDDVTEDVTERRHADEHAYT